MSRSSLRKLLLGTKKPKFTIEPASGGFMGPYCYIKLDGRFVGYFYIDYEKHDDYEALVKKLTS